ncbi:hypothetical protein AY600_16105, partial [Phormidium willei BDU 130791]
MTSASGMPHPAPQTAESPAAPAAGALAAPTADALVGPAPRRSYLYVPGNRPERFPKAQNAGADAIILDLEDAVPLAEKAAARAAACGFLASDSAARGPDIFVRINPPQSRVGLADLLALTDLERPAPTAWRGLLLPKVETPETLHLVDALLTEAGLPLEVAALLETAAGIERAGEIAAAGPRLSALMFGGADLAADLGVALAWDPLVFARARLVQAAAMHGKAAVEMPWVALDDAAGYRDDLTRSFALGFTARAAIHPRQIAAIHA